jgi:hypothetical protein
MADRDDLIARADGEEDFGGARKERDNTHVGK